MDIYCFCQIGVFFMAYVQQKYSPFEANPNLQKSSSIVKEKVLKINRGVCVCNSIFIPAGKFSESGVPILHI